MVNTLVVIMIVVGSFVIMLMCMSADAREDALGLKRSGQFINGRSQNSIHLHGLAYAAVDVVDRAFALR